jgi:hypothetical protein
MSSWATVSQLRTLAVDVGVAVPIDNTACERLLQRAQDGCEVWGLRMRLESLSGLSAAQTGALADAACRQALWLRDLADEWLGDDGVATTEGITFSRDPRPRISPAALEALAHHGLVARTGTVLPDPAPERPPLPWWWWI